MIAVYEEFKNHAAECRRMAEFSRDGEIKSTWQRMAERWERLARDHREAAARAEAATRERIPTRKRSGRLGHAAA